MADRLEIGTACAIAGVAVFSIHGVYTQHAGSLNAARQAPDDPATNERLRDADILTGGLVVLVGGALAIMTKAPHPLVLSLLAFGVVATYYHVACASHGVATVQPMEDDTQDDDSTD